MGNITKKQYIPAQKPNLEKNLKRVLNWEREDTKILKKSAGMLKGRLKKSPVSYQRELRKEWERRK